MFILSKIQYIYTWGQLGQALGMDYLSKLEYTGPSLQVPLGLIGILSLLVLGWDSTW